MSAEGQPAIRIEQISGWVVCKSSQALSGALSVQVTNSDFSKSIEPNYSASYVTTDTFDYSVNPASYTDTTPSPVILSPGTIEFSGDNLMNCFAPRHLVVYTGYSAKTLAAIAQWKSAMNAILNDISSLRDQNPDNYPSSYILEHAQAKMKTALAALP